MKTAALVLLALPFLFSPLYAEKTKEKRDSPKAKTAAVEPAAAVEAKPVKASQQVKLAEFAAKYGATEAELNALRDKKLGWGDIALALAIAEKSGKPLSEVMALRDTKLGWGAIAQKYGFKLGDVQGKGKQIEKEARKAERAAKPGKADAKEAKEEKKEDGTPVAPAAGPKSSGQDK